jgi:hypothetical protein
VANKDNPIGTTGILEDAEVMAPEKPDTKKAIKWFVDRMKKKIKVSVNAADKTLTVGHMYMFRYDPKTKDTLPYWDTAPLVIPIGYYKDGFLGLNLHYISATYRAALLKLMIEAFGKGDQETRYIRATYKKLNALARASMFQPCVKRYLYSHMTAQFQRVPPSEWTNAIMLPTARWVGNIKPTAVYRHSRSKF